MIKSVQREEVPPSTIFNEFDLARGPIRSDVSSMISRNVVNVSFASRRHFAGLARSVDDRGSECCVAKNALRSTLYDLRSIKVVCFRSKHLIFDAENRSSCRM